MEILYLLNILGEMSLRGVPVVIKREAISLYFSQNRDCFAALAMTLPLFIEKITRNRKLTMKDMQKGII